MKFLLLSIGFFIVLSCTAQTKVTYSGSFGDTSRIEMEISSNNGKDYNGRYRFENTRHWILLRGALYFDRRNKNPQNLVLHQFDDDRDSAVFDLYMDGKNLAGTWQKNPNKPVLAVNLMQGDLLTVNEYDGLYVEKDNSLLVKSISDNSIQVEINITAKNNCSEIKLKGTLLKSGNQWKGSMPDLAEKGEAAVIISFESDKANVEIIPAFLPGNKCEINNAVYVKQKPGAN